MTHPHEQVRAQWLEACGFDYKAAFEAVVEEVESLREYVDSMEAQTQEIRRRNQKTIDRNLDLLHQRDKALALHRQHMGLSNVHCFCLGCEMAQALGVTS